jgi:Protein of unknown function (DUF2778)
VFPSRAGEGDALFAWGEKVQFFRFVLNGKDMSSLQVSAHSFSAFSGHGVHKNRKAYACVKGSGPIPPGNYFVIDRQQGGLLGPLRSLLRDRAEWFALYAEDGTINDETLCDQVVRGNFRLHPKGPLGRSEGCITLDSPTEFRTAQAIIRANPLTPIPGSQLKAYGKVVVS